MAEIPHTQVNHLRSVRWSKEQGKDLILSMFFISGPLVLADTIDNVALSVESIVSIVNAGILAADGTVDSLPLEQLGFAPAKQVGLAADIVGLSANPAAVEKDVITLPALVDGSQGILLTLLTTT